MKLTQAQRRTLTLYLEFEHSPPSRGKLFLISWRIYLLITGVGAIAVYLMWVAHGMEAAAMVATFFTGMIIRDSAHFGRFVQVWPVVTQVLDRDRIREMLSADDDR